MKKNLIFLTMIALFGLIIAGCKDKKEDTFTTLTVEQNKENIAKEGDEVITQMNGLKNVEAVFTLQDLTTLIDASQPSYAGLKAIHTLDFVTNLNKSTDGLIKLRATDPDFQSLSDLFIEESGIYTYNKNTKEFVRSNSSTEITYKFPIGDSQTNNGILTINNFSSKVAKNVDFKGTNLIKSLDISLKNGSTTILNLVVRGEYNSDDVPTNLSETLTLSGTYVLSNSMTYNSSNVTYNYSFKNGSKVIMGAHFESSGSYNYDNISGLGDDSSEASIIKLLKSANAWIQLGNIKLQGLFDYKSLMDNLNKAYAEDTTDYAEEITDYEQSITKEANIFNKYCNFYLKYADNDNIIAKNTFFAKPYKNAYGKDVYSLSSKIIFKDGSSMDKSFYNEAFDSFIVDMQKFMKDMNKNYGDL